MNFEKISLYLCISKKDFFFFFTKLKITRLKYIQQMNIHINTYHKYTNSIHIYEFLISSVIKGMEWTIENYNSCYELFLLALIKCLYN